MPEPGVKEALRRIEHCRRTGETRLDLSEHNLERLPKPKSSSANENSRSDTTEPVSMFLRQILKRSVVEEVWTDNKNGVSYAYGSLAISPQHIEGVVRGLAAQVSP